MRFLLILLSCSGCLLTYSQKETSNWFLSGNRISITSSGVTTGLPFPSANFYPTYASTSVADSLGNLLFAFDGNKIIDKNLQVMPAIATVNLQCSSGDAMAQKIPASTKYILFYESANSWVAGSNWTLKYAVIDLSLNNGAGDVIAYNQVVDTSLSKGYTLAQGPQTADAWLITHRNLSDSFLTYKISSTGLSATAVLSQAGTDVNTNDYFFATLKTSHDGKMIAGVTYRDYTNLFANTFLFVEVFNFNPLTGVLTDKVRSTRLGNYFQSYLSTEFSADERVLYVGLVQRICCLQPCGYGWSTVEQFNLCYTDSVLFTRYSMRLGSSFQWCNPTVTWGNIQLGADKRVHMPYTGITVATIERPNRIGSYAGYVFNAYQLPVSNGGNIATPRFQHRLLEKAVKNNITYDGGCHPSPITFHVTNDTISSFNWNFGDPSSASNTSTAANPSHVFSGPGMYTVSVHIYNSQSQLIDSLSELVEIKDPANRILYGYPTDTSFCSGNSLSIHLSVVNGIYNWSQASPTGTIYNLATSDSININTSGTYYVQMRQNDCNGCIKLDSIHVTVLPVPNINLPPDRNLCSGDSLHLIVYNYPQPSYIWSTGDTTNSIWVHNGGTFWLQGEYNQNGCPRRDTIVITSVPGVQFSLPNDTTLCNNQTLMLSPGVSNATYAWQNGSTQTSYLVTQPGTYWVNVTSSNGCHHADTIHVSYLNAQQVFLGNDTTLCQGDSLTLHANVPNALYQWSTGAIADHITINQSGSYWVAVNNGNCIVSDTIQVTFHAPPVVFLGNDSTLCPGSTVVLHGGNPGATYNWQNGSANESLVVSQPGSYWLVLHQFGCTVSDSINIGYYNLPALNLGPDVSFCAGDSALLNAGGAFTQFQWNNGATTQQLTVFAVGIYSVIATTADGCKAYDTARVLSVYPVPVVQLNHDSTLCTNDSRVLDAGGGFASYLWNDGTTQQTRSVTTTGFYLVVVTDNKGCKGKDSTTVTRLLPLPVSFLPGDTAICSYGTLDLQANRAFNNYLWNDNETTRKITISLPGLYWLQVTDNLNCKGRDSILVKPKDCLQGLFVPSAFTPNHDGKNDLLRPMLFGKIRSFNFSIYNRWGQLVFHSVQLSRGWNGEYAGHLQDSNIFIWVCTYQLEGEPVKTEKGTIMLIH